MVSIGPHASLDDPASLLDPVALLHLAPALLFAILLYVLDRRISHWLLMPAFLFATLVLFYGSLWITGTSIEEATSASWLPNDSSSAIFSPTRHR